VRIEAVTPRKPGLIVLADCAAAQIAIRATEASGFSRQLR